MVVPVRKAVIQVAIDLDERPLITATAGIAGIMKDLRNEALATTRILADISKARETITTLAAIAKEATRSAGGLKDMETQLNTLTRSETKAKAAFKSIKSMLEYKPPAAAPMRPDGLRPDLAPPPIRDPLTRSGKGFAGIPPSTLPIIAALASPSLIGAILNRYDPMLKGAADRYFLKDVDPRINEYLLGTTPGGLYAGGRTLIDQYKHPEGRPTIPDPLARMSQEKRARDAEQLKADKALSYYGGEPPPPKWPVALGGNVYWVESEEQYERLMKGVAKGTIDTWAPHLSPEKLKGTRWQKPKPPRKPWDRDDFPADPQLYDPSLSPLGMVPPYFAEPRTIPPSPTFSFVLGASTRAERQAELEAEREEAVIFQDQAEGEEALLSLEAEKELILDLVEALKQEGEILKTIDELKAEGDLIGLANAIKAEADLLEIAAALKREGDALALLEAVPPYVSKPPTIAPAPTYTFVKGATRSTEIAAQAELEAAQLETLASVEEQKTANQAIELQRIEALAESYVSYCDPAPYIVEGLKSGEIKQAIEDFGVALGTKAAEELVHKLIIMGIMAILQVATGGGAPIPMARGGVIHAQGGLAMLSPRPGGYTFPWAGKWINAAEGGRPEVLGIFPEGQRGRDLIMRELLPQFFGEAQMVNKNVNTFSPTIELRGTDPQSIGVSIRAQDGGHNRARTQRKAA